jgi:hypothetical protein
LKSHGRGIPLNCTFDRKPICTPSEQRSVRVFPLPYLESGVAKQPGKDRMNVTPFP